MFPTRAPPRTEGRAAVPLSTARIGTPSSPVAGSGPSGCPLQTVRRRGFGEGGTGAGTISSAWAEQAATAGAGNASPARKPRLDTARRATGALVGNGSGHTGRYRLERGDLGVEH